MIRPVALYIGLRYTRAKRRNHFISFISLASMLGIALGVMVLITVLSVLNGFDDQIQTRFFAVQPAITIATTDKISQSWENLSKKLKQQFPAIKQAAPYVEGKGMLVNQGTVSAVEVYGILPLEQSKLTEINKKMTEGDYASLQSGDYKILLGDKLANSLGLRLGDSVNLFTPQTSATPMGIIPRYRRFTVGGIFSTKSGFGVDSYLAYIHLNDAEKLFPKPTGVAGLQLTLTNPYLAPSLTNSLFSALPNNYFVSNWTEQFGPLFRALAMEKTMFFVILLLIVGVAAFNLVSTLVMVVNDKRSDIAILKTLGASPKTILSIFVIQGAVVGLLGTLLGIIAGVILALNVTDIVNAIQHYFGVQFISSSVYLVDFLPSKLEMKDVLSVSACALGLSLLATLYPSFIAGRTEPAEALRYE